MAGKYKKNLENSVKILGYILTFNLYHDQYINKIVNYGKFWRPWHKFDDMDRVLRSATDQEYKNILRELIRGEVVLPLETEKKKKIQLEKKQKKQEKQTGSWIKLEEPADKINCVKVGDTSEKGKQYIKQKE